MKRFLTIGAVALLLVGVSIPAGALSRDDTSVAQATAGEEVEQQAGTVLAIGAVAVADRDAFKGEPKPVVVSATILGRYTGSIPNMYKGSLPVWPVTGGKMNDGFGPRSDGFHSGIDIIAPQGTSILAAEAGTVIEVAFIGGWGQYVKIDHGGGVATLYAHMISGSPTVKPGQQVAAGQVIGKVGATGYATTYHCHFEVYLNGTRVNPVPFFA